MPRSQILGTLIFTTCLVAGLAACSANTGGSAVLPVAAATSTPANRPPRTCINLEPARFIGAPPAKADDAKPIGWTILLWDKAGSPSWEYSAVTTWTIGAVAADPATCLAKFEIVGHPTAATTTTPPQPAGPLTTVSDGTYLVGTDMVAGSYKSPGSEDSGMGCYWKRSKDDAGDNIIANNYAKGPARFTAKKGEFVSIRNCTFTKV